MFKWFLSIEMAIYNKLGYNFVVHLEDFLLATSCIFIGTLIAFLLSGNVLLNIRKIPIKADEKLGKFKRVKWAIIDEGNAFLADPQNVGEAVQTVLVIVFKRFFTYKDFGYRDERRTKIFIFFYLLIGTLLTIFAFLSAATVFDHPI